MRPAARASITLGVLGASLVAGCSMRFSWPRHAVDVALDVVPLTGVPLTGDQGHAVSIDALTMVVDSVELVLCDSDTPQERTYDMPYASIFSTRSADAHGLPGPTRLATPVVFDALSERPGGVPLGQMTPPPGSYCEVIVGFGPADDDAVGLEDSPDMLGATVHACGVTERPDPETFDATTSRRAVATVTLTEPLVFGSDLDVHATLQIDLPLDDALLEAIAADGPDAALAHVRSQLGAHGEVLD